MRALGPLIAAWSAAALAACSVTTVTFSPGPPEDCSTPGDEDGNGLADCADPACAAAPACRVGCGNARFDPGEVCDDGNTVDGDGCSQDCRSTEVCGNGIVDTAVGEVCDDGNTRDGDHCSADCHAGTGCGNGRVDVDGAGHALEECDDGNTDNNDDCRNDCIINRCGDGFQNTHGTPTHREACDPADPVGAGVTTVFPIETATCNLDCTAASCGDGKVNQHNHEACDDGNTINGDACDNNCTLPACGNHVLDPGEQCDDGNLTDNDGCDHNCTLPACGNGVVGPGEQCDDGNTRNGDACDANCTIPACRNGIVDPGEQCDDGNAVNGDGCDNNCTVPRCGNGVLDPGEQCDDGNAVNGDGCDNNCTIPRCGNGFVDPGELCDDGNAVNGDGCDSNCTPPRCGNGIADPGEQCDDGNAVNGDGCDTNCTVTACGNGVVSANEQCDLGPSNSDTGACTSHCRVAVCGDGFAQAVNGEQCDDPALPTSCPYTAVQTPCQVCNASCHLVAGTAAFCGDGNVDHPFEICDDGVRGCGTCSAACDAVVSQAATGLVFAAAGAQYRTAGDTFTLSDGTLAVTFELTAGAASPGNTRIPVAAGDTAAAVASHIAQAIAARALHLTATAIGGGVTLTNQRATTLGNVAIREAVATTDFAVDGMSGGQGGRCTAGQVCSQAIDCASNQCNTTHRCQ